MQEMTEALQSAQESLQQAGQQSAQNDQEGEATEDEMGKEFKPGGASQGGQQGQQAGQKAGGQKPGGQPNPGSGGGMGGPGRGAGGSAGPQQPLPGVKQDKLIKGMEDARGKKLSKGYMGTPDPSQDRAAYYSIVPEKVRAAEASLTREESPAGHKKAVRDYFDAIQPR